MPAEPELSEAEEVKIRSEERYRKTIRDQLEKDDPEKTRHWLLEFLDTPFGIWILTVVLGGLASWGWGIWQEGEVRRERVDKIFVEIAHRFAEANTTWSQLREEHGASERKDYFFRMWEGRILEPLLRSKIPEGNAPKSYSSAYDEFKSTSMYSLLLEIEGSGGRKDRLKKDEIKRIADSLSEKLKDANVVPSQVQAELAKGLKLE